MEYNCKMQGTCASRVKFTLAADGTVTGIRFTGGCDGNLKALAIVLDGWQAEEIIKRLRGNTCGFKKTSCADQLSIALENALAQNKLTGDDKQ